jgi:threonine dehydratase
MINQNDIRAAQERIKSHIRLTPLLDVAIAANAGNGVAAQSVQLKLEYLQRGGTFKARGAFNALLSQSSLPAAGVVAASGGNHGIAVATAAQTLQIPAHIFVPTIASAAKVQTLQRLGAVVHQQGERFADAYAASQLFATQTGALQTHAYDQFETLCGQGTVAKEWQEQNTNNPLDTVLVAVGGGGLIGGMAAWYRGSTKVVAVESEGCATLHRALAAGKPTDGPVGGLAADSLGATRIGELMFPIAQQFISQSILVSDDAIAQAQTWAWRELRIACEPGGAAALAALLSGRYKPEPNERVGVLMCGANVVMDSIKA